MDVSLLLGIGGIIALVAGGVAVLVATFKTNTSRVWREEAEAQKTRADRLLNDIEKMTKEIEGLKEYTHALVRILSTIDPTRLEDLRLRRGL